MQYFISATVYVARQLGSVPCEGRMEWMWGEQLGASCSQLNIIMRSDAKKPLFRQLI